MFSNERPWTMILGAFSARVSGEMFLIFQVSLVTAASRPPPPLSLSLSLPLPSSLSFTPVLPWPKRRRRSASRFKLASLDARKCHVMMASIAHCIRCPLVRSSRLNVIGEPSAFSQRVARQPPAIYSSDLLETNPFNPPTIALSQKMHVFRVYQ